MLRRISFILAVALCAAPRLAAGATVTLPAAASIQGVVPFYSDVRVFNTSYADAVTVTATYRCFLGPCPASPPQLAFELAPRQSRAFNDIVAVAFAQPNTAGGVELSFDGDPALIVVTSRLYSTAPTPTVGMFIPGLDASKASVLSALTSVRTRGPGAGFRTNVGVFNPGDSATLVTFTVFADGARVGGAVRRRVEAHSGKQVNGIYVEAGASSVQTANGVILVQSDAPVFSYAAVIDNATSDPYFVVGSADQAAGPTPTLTPSEIFTRTPSQTPPGGGTGTPTITPTLTPTGPSPTPSITLTPSNTFTPSLTFTASQTFTPSLTPTITPTFTRSNTPTITPSPTRTLSATPTGSATATASPTLTGTATATLTPTPSFTATRTASITPSPTASRTPSITPTPNPNVVLVGSGGTNFVPSILTVHVGDTVQWQWVADLHSTTSGTCTAGGCTPGPPCLGCTPWDSGIQNNGATFSHTFTSTNSYTYFCQVHGFMMQGTIVVNP